MSKRKQWNRLDNAAKIFPPTTTRRDTKVFRFVCELTEEVDGSILQHALENAIGDFPFYRSVLKKGLFWYYFEESDIRPSVMEETIPICSPIYSVDSHALLFRVLYFKKRISLEVFHALSDGNGAVQFLRALVFYYLKERHGLPSLLADYDSSRDQKNMDAFYKYYNKTEKPTRAKHYRGYRLRGQRLSNYRLGVTEGYLSVRSVLEKAHECNASLSEFLIAVLICAIHDGMAVRDQTRPVVITVPVDLRRFFPAPTARNFFGVIHVAHDFRKNGSEFSDVLRNVQTHFRELLTRENLHGIIGRYSAIENNPFIKGIPLQIKIPSLRLAGLWADREDTSAFSNIGKVEMPEDAAKYIHSFSVYVSTKRPQLCLCSFGDTLTISISSPLVDTTVQRQFFRRLSGLGINTQIISNLEQLGEEGDYASL